MLTIECLRLPPDRKRERERDMGHVMVFASFFVTTKGTFFSFFFLSFHRMYSICPIPCLYRHRIRLRPSFLIADPIFCVSARYCVSARLYLTVEWPTVFYLRRYTLKLLPIEGPSERDISCKEGGKGHYFLPSPPSFERRKVKSITGVTSRHLLVHGAPSNHGGALLVPCSVQRWILQEPIRSPHQIGRA